MPDFFQAAKSLCYRHNITNYTTGLPSIEPHKVFVAALLRSTTAPGKIQEELIAQVKTSQAVIIINGKVSVLTAPMLNEGQPRFSASIGDDVDRHHPCSVHDSIFSVYFTTIVRHADAIELGLPTAPEDPAQQDGPENAAPADGAPALAYERIHWTVANDGDGPTVGSFPLVCPIADGTIVPIGRSIDDQFTEDEVPDHALRVWLQGRRYITKHNNGLSVTGDCLLFPADSFTMDAFEHLNIVADVNAFPAPSMLLPNTDEYAAVCQHMKNFDNQFYLKAVHDLPDEPPAVAAAGYPAGPNGGFTLEHVTELLKATKNNHADTSISYQEKQEKKSNVDIENRYRIMTATIGIGPNGEQTIVPGTLRPAFKEFIAATKSTDSERMLRDILSTACDSARLEDTALAGYITMTSDVDPVWVRCLKNCLFLGASPTHGTEVIRRQLTIWSFLTPNVNSVEYREKKVNSERLSAQLMAGEDTSKLTRRSTDLDVHGQQDNGRDVLSGIANTHLVFSKAIVEDFQNSLLWFSMDQYLKLLRSKEGHSFCQTYQTTPQVFKNFLLDVQHIISPYVQLAAKPELRTLVANGDTLPLAAFRLAEQQATMITEPLSNLMARNDIDRYGNTLPFMGIFELFPKKRAHEHLSNHTNGHANSTHNADYPSRNNGRGDNPHNQTGTDGGNSNRNPPTQTNTDGPLIYDLAAAGRPLIFCRTLVKKTVSSNDTSRTAICFNSALKGRSCTKGAARCAFFHFNMANDIPTESQAEFFQWVSTTPHLTWAPGKGPISGTPP
jgi:hypothetical protein